MSPPAKYDVFVDGSKDASPAGKDRLADALASHYGLPPEQARRMVAGGRFRVKRDIDLALARRYVSHLESLGARAAVAEATARPAAARPAGTAPAAAHPAASRPGGAPGAARPGAPEAPLAPLLPTPPPATPHPALARPPTASADARLAVPAAMAALRGDEQGIAIGHFLADHGLVPAPPGAAPVGTPPLGAPLLPDLTPPTRSTPPAPRLTPLTPENEEPAPSAPRPPAPGFAAPIPGPAAPGFAAPIPGPAAPGFAAPIPGPAAPPADLSGELVGLDEGVTEHATLELDLGDSGPSAPAAAPAAPGGEPADHEFLPPEATEAALELALDHSSGPGVPPRSRPATSANAVDLSDPVVELQLATDPAAPARGAGFGLDEAPPPPGARLEIAAPPRPTAPPPAAAPAAVAALRPLRPVPPRPATAVAARGAAAYGVPGGLFGGRLRQNLSARVMLGVIFSVTLAFIPASFYASHAHRTTIHALQLEERELREKPPTAAPQERTPAVVREEISGARTRAFVITLMIWVTLAAVLGFLWYRFA